jgi:hypothetical protein
MLKLFHHLILYIVEMSGSTKMMRHLAAPALQHCLYTGNDMPYEPYTIGTGTVQQKCLNRHRYPTPYRARSFLMLSKHRSSKNFSRKRSICKIYFRNSFEQQLLSDIRVTEARNGSKTTIPKRLQK